MLKVDFLSYISIRAMCTALTNRNLLLYLNAASRKVWCDSLCGATLQKELSRLQKPMLGIIVNVQKDA